MTSKINWNRTKRGYSHRELDAQSVAREMAIGKRIAAHRKREAAKLATLKFLAWRISHQKSDV